MNPLRIALLGTGLLGHSIAERLLLGNNPLYVYNRSRSKAEDLVSLGATLCNSPAEAIKAAEGIFLVLTDAKATAEVLALAEEKTSFRGKTFFQVGTISPDETLELDRQITQRGGYFVALPVLGSKNEAKKGTLLLMFGASEEHYHKWHDFLSQLGQVFFVADPKKAAALKLALNQLIISSIIGFSLSFSLILKEEIHPELFMSILRKSALYCSTFDKKLPRLLKKDYSSANFTLELLLKDLRLCLEELEKLSIESAPLKTSKTIIEQALKRGYGDKDYSALFEVVFAPHPMNEKSPEIIVEKNPSPSKLTELGIADWPLWEKDISSFDWHYEEKESCYILEGEAIIYVENKEPLQVSKGQLVIFPAGLSCRWEITSKIKKHYRIG